MVPERRARLCSVSAPLGDLPTRADSRRYLRHVLESRLPIDINILCTFMEFLTGAFLVAHSNFSFHRITMPQKQIVHLLRRLPSGPRPDLRYFAMDLLKEWGRILKVLVAREHSGTPLYYCWLCGADAINLKVVYFSMDVSELLKYEEYSFRACKLPLPSAAA